MSEASEFPREYHFRLWVVLGFGALMLGAGAALTLFVQSRLRTAPPSAVAALPTSTIPEGKYDPLAFSPGEYVLAPNRAGKVYVFRVMGHVFIQESLRVEGKPMTFEPVISVPGVRKAHDQTPLDARFDQQFALELLLIGAPADSVDEARQFVKQKAAADKEPTIHVLDLHQAMRLTIQSVIRIEVHELHTETNSEKP